MKKLWAAYRSFTRAERSGIVVLILLLLILVAIRISMLFFIPSKPVDATRAQIALTWEHRQQPEDPAPVKTDTIIDINSADSMALVALDGIGAKLAHRILERRQQLGRFRNYGELWQVYHFNSATKEEILKRTRIVTDSY